MSAPEAMDQRRCRLPKVDVKKGREMGDNGDNRGSQNSTRLRLVSVSRNGEISSVTLAAVKTPKLLEENVVRLATYHP